MHPNTYTIHYADALAGAGKTYSAIRHAHKLASRGQKVIIAQPSRHLITMTVEKELKALDPIRHTVIHGGITNPVIPEIMNHLNKTEDGGELLFITQEAFLRLPFIRRRKDWVLIWDEYPQVDAFFEANLPDTGHLLTPHIEALPDGVRYCLAAPAGSDGAEVLRAISENEDDDDVYALFETFCRRLLSPHWRTYLHASQWEGLTSGEGAVQRLTSHALLQPSAFAGFKQVIMLGAYFSETLMNLLWSNEGVTFSPFNLPLRYTRHANGHLLRIYYLTEEPWSKAIRKRQDGEGVSVLEKIIDRCREHFGDQPFVWMGNRDIGDGVFGLPSAFRLPNSPHGLNEFQHIHNAVVISALNPPPSHFSFLDDHHANGEEVRTAGYRQAVYQAAMRCSLRNPDDENLKTVVVMDRESAEWLALKFPGCSVDVLGEQPLGAVRKRGGRPRVHANDATRKAAHRRETEKRLLIEQDIINSEDLRHWGYPDLVKAVEASMTERGPISSQTADDLRGSAGTVYASLYDTTPLAHIDYESDDAFIGGLRALHLRTIHEKDEAGLMSPAHFDSEMSDETSRGLANVCLLRGVWLDNDGGDLSPDVFARLFPGLRIVAWNTFSCTAERPRWRAFIPTTEAMSKAVHRLILDQIIRALNKEGFWTEEELARRPRLKARKLHGFDLSKLNAASMFFLPAQARDPKASFFVDYGEGQSRRRAIEPWVWIKKSIMPTKPPEEVVVSPPPQPAVCAGGSAKLRAIREALAGQKAASHQERRKEEAVAGWRSIAGLKGHGHNGFFALAAALQRAGLDDASIRSILDEEALHARNSKARRAEIRHILASLKSSRRP